MTEEAHRGTNAIIPIVKAPRAAANWPFGENPPFMPGSHFLNVVIILTRLSMHPISLAKVSDAATATDAVKSHTPISQSPSRYQLQRDQEVLICNHICPTAMTISGFIQSIAVFSSKRHFVALCDAIRKLSKTNNQDQCPRKPTTQAMTAAITPDLSKIRYLEANATSPIMMNKHTMKFHVPYVGFHELHHGDQAVSQEFSLKFFLA